MASSQLARVVPIDVRQMPHEVHIRRSGEDWAGVTNQRERKKLQNRLNQRARRLRKRVRHENESQHCNATVSTDDDVLFGNITEEDLGQKRAFLRRFAKQALSSYATSQPAAGHLSRLIQWNVINSLTRNSIVLGLEGDWLVCSAVSPFHRKPDAFAGRCPGNLIPTGLQRRIPHHPWVDLLPLPRMRDNFLVAVAWILSAQQEQQLWDDLIESWRGDRDWAGMIVWGEPWDPRSWEVTVPFLQRWGWLLQGCHEILAATNYWRRQRGERELSLEVWQQRGKEVDNLPGHGIMLTSLGL